MCSAQINLAVVDVFDGKSNCPDVVQELAVEIETSLRYAYSYFNRSTANRKELQTVGRAFGRCVIPHSLCETRWLFRYLARKALWQGRDAVVGFLRDNYQRKASHEGRCILQMLVEHADKFKGTLDVMRIIFLLSTRMQTRNLSEWIVYLHFQLADRALEELTEELDMGRVKKFAKFMRVRLVERCPFMKSAQASQIHDFSMLKKSGAEFCFSKDLVCKAAHAHFAIHERHYGGLSEEHLVKFFLRVYHRLAKVGHQRAIYDEGELFAVLLQEDKRHREYLRVYRMVLEIQSTYSMDSADVERAFSAMARIKSKSRNRLASHHFVSCMWMSLSATPDIDVVYAHWAQSKARREVVVRAVKRDSAGQPVHSQPNEDYFADSDFEPDSAESDEDDYDYEVVQKSGFLVEEDWSEND